MEIIHKIGFNLKNSPKLYDLVVEHKIKHTNISLPGEGGNLICFNISENNPFWDETLISLQTSLKFDIYHSGDNFETYFTENEIRSAEWLRVKSEFDHGYPEPNGLWPVKQKSLINVCSRCGIYEQNNHFRIAKEPRMGKNSFMSLISSGEIFATGNVFDKFAAINTTGFEAREVILHRKNEISQIIKQVYITQKAAPGLLLVERSRNVLCPICGTRKLYPHIKGKFLMKKESIPDNTDFILTSEWFGVGLMAFREILVSNRIARLILDEKWQGVRLKVVELVDSNSDRSGFLEASDLK